MASRRKFLQGLGTLALSTSIACSKRKPSSEAMDESAKEKPTQSERFPCGFVGHGAPTLATTPAKGQDLSRWTGAIQKPSAILVVSAHWQKRPVSIGTTRTIPLIYDFYGFEKELYELQYPAPGAPFLAESLKARLSERMPVEEEPERGLDHGAWVPLLWMYPEADVPVLPLSLPTQNPAELFELGRILAPLRDEGVFILGSGNLTHNLRRIDMAGSGTTPAWAAEFDEWIRQVLVSRDYDALMDYEQKAPAVDLAHPSREHFVPIILAAGAASVAGDGVGFPVQGFEFLSISRRCVQFG